MDGFLEQCREPGAGAVERADFSEQKFDGPIAGIAVHVSFDLVAEATATGASGKHFERRGKDKVFFDKWQRVVLTRKVVAENPRNISACNARQGRVVGL